MMRAVERNSDGGHTGRRRGRTLVAIGALGIVAIVLAGSIALRASGVALFSTEKVPFSLPDGWHEASPATSDDIRYYAFSPDVPGLMYACTAARTGHTSADLGHTPATYWQTSDGGASWRKLGQGEQKPTCDTSTPFYSPNGNISAPLETGVIAQGYIILASAQDYRAPGAWYRLLGPNNANKPGQAVLEHSTDNGHTWTLLGNIGPTGDYMDASTGLVTAPAHPNSLCVALAPQIYQQQSNTQGSIHGDTLAAPAGPPYQPPREVALVTSGDGGATLHSTTLAPANDSGPAAHLLTPNAQMDARGRCYAATWVGDYYRGSAPTISLWQADPTSAAQPRVVVQIHDHDVSMMIVTTVDGEARIYAVAQTFQSAAETTLICQDDVCPPEPPLAVPHLIWTALP